MVYIVSLAVLYSVFSIVVPKGVLPELLPRRETDFVQALPADD